MITIIIIIIIIIKKNDFKHYISKVKKFYAIKYKKGGLLERERERKRERLKS